MADWLEHLQRIEQEIRELPVGTVVYKQINGKRQPYLQWTEKGKSKSRYIKKAEREAILTQVERRNQLKKERKSILAQMAAQSNRSPYQGMVAEDLAIYGDFSNRRRQQDGILHSGTSSVPTVDTTADPYGRDSMDSIRFRRRFQTNVVTGAGLLAMAENVRGWQHRDSYATLQAFLHTTMVDRVCLIYGLRRTGKTTMIRQLILDMSPKEQAQAAYIKIKGGDDLDRLDQDLESLWNQGYRYVFIDEVTLLKNFIDSAAIFSDIYAAQGMKIVLSGTDSLGFWFAQHDELYDRAVMIHTTFIPYREHVKLLGHDSIDEYIRYGGTLRIGETDLEMHGFRAEEASFRDDESTRRYIDTAICRNIQHSLACCEAGGHFRHLQDLYEADELTSAINRIIEDMNHRFLLRVLTERFKSHDLGSAKDLLRRDRNPERRSRLLTLVDEAAVTEALMDILEIRNREQQSVHLTDAHIYEIREYLEALELIAYGTIETILPMSSEPSTASDLFMASDNDTSSKVLRSSMAPWVQPLEHIIFTQPGMRYCQAEALVAILLRDPVFMMARESEKRMVCDRLLEDVRGRMLEDIVLFETAQAWGKKRRVFKLQFAVGEFDMVIYDARTDTCEIFEIKHSREQAAPQYRYLTDEKLRALTQNRFGRIVRSVVLYRGEPAILENGIEYENVEAYLKNL